MKKRAPNEVSDIMRKVGPRDTAPEMALRHRLWRMGLRYRLHVSGLPGKPDIVFPKARLAVFVDGDFWHGNQWRLRGLESLEGQFTETDNRPYWLEKIRRNEARDILNTRSLTGSGWSVLRVYESHVRRDPDGCARMVMEAVKGGKATPCGARLAEMSVAEFFAGIGLMRMGLERRGWRTSFANDIDPKKYEMYRANFGDGARFSLTDIHRLKASEVPTVTLATASFPCNDLSLAGGRGGLTGKHSSAYWGFIRVLKGMRGRRPPLVLLENVAGLLSSHGGDDLRDALLALNGLGYSVDAFMLNAADFVPQSRVRLFVVGSLSSCHEAFKSDGRANVPVSPVRPQALIDFIARHPEVNWSVRPMPGPVPSAVKLADILEDLPENAHEWWSADRANYLLGQMSVRHRGVIDDMITGDGWSYATAFRRVRAGRTMAEVRSDGVAGCLRTPRGGSGRQILLKAGRGKFFARLLTPRECARLMGADDYRIDVPSNQALFGFGDAVCAPVVEWIATRYLNPLVGAGLRGTLLAPGQG